MRSNFLWGGAVVAVVAACSSSSQVSAQQACSDLANSICNQINTCAPYNLTIAYGSVSACAARAAIECPSAIGAPGSTATAANVESCAQGYASLSCTDLFNGVTPSACQISGTLAAGSQCGSDLQCSGTGAYCKATTSSCGVCATKAVAGGGCTSTTDCQSGLACVLNAGATTGSCVTKAAQGSACSATQPCQGALACVNGTCAQPLGAGATCNSEQGGCNGALGYYCSAAGVCEQVQTAAAGASCGESSSGITECAAGTCKLASGATTGTCQGFAADGATCDAVTGPGCLSPAACVNGSCTIASPASCN